MNRSYIIAGALCLASLGSGSLADPYCDDMLSADTLERRYQRLAPIYNETETGWIFGSDQFGHRYVLNSREEGLLGQLVSELAARGTELAIYIAPPRPVIAGQDVVDATSGQPGAHDLAEQAAAFSRMMAQIAEAGAIAPNLLAMAQANPELQAAFYFQRDTHWTNIGAAHSALALAQAIDPAALPAFDAARLPVVEMAVERGSLSNIVDATCGFRPDGEESPLFDYSGVLPQAGGLLDGPAETDGNVVLLGTSFSDRYGRDQYQSAEALSGALGQLVDNRSVSGGGMIGPFEAYVLSGDYAAEQPSLIIWEFPYTYQLNEAGLRQLLGAIRSTDVGAHSTEMTLADGAATLEWPAGQAAVDLIGLRIDGAPVRDIVVRLVAADGSERDFRLRRKSRMEDVITLSEWWLDLSGVGMPIQSITVEFRGTEAPEQVDLLVPSVTG
jgi:alginate biosynthesis protein AlgX